jgi:hypothetical protein
MKKTARKAKITVKTKPKRGRRPKSEAIEVTPEVVKPPAPPAPSVRTRKTPKLVGSSSTVSVDSDVFVESPPMPVKKEPDPLRPDQDLTEAQRAEFAAVLNKKLGLEERADLLVELAHKKCTKTAAVGLRAIQVINDITRMTEDGASEAPPMFNIPDGAEISVEVEVPEK